MVLFDSRLHNENLGETRVMTLQIQETFNHVKKQIERKVLNPYLLHYITSPTIDQHKLLILTSILKKIGLTKSQLEACAVTTMLIQIALDTHDTVKTEEDKEHKSLQLTVLAGDFYSGLYYKILASHNDIEMIRVLAEGIKDVNEQKINLYQKDFHHIDELMDCVKKIESALFTKIINFFHCQSWNPFVQNFLLLNRLLMERRTYLQYGTSIIFDGINKLFLSTSGKAFTKGSNGKQNSNIIVFDHYIEKLAEMIESEANKIPFINDFLRQSIHSLLNENKQLARTFVEEG